MNMKLAIIDFDGTLFPRETLPFLMKFWIRDGQNKRKHNIVMAKIMPYYLLYRLSFGNRKIKEGFRTHSVKVFNRLFDGMVQEELEGFMQRAGAEIRTLLRPSLLKEIKHLKEEGFTTVVLSGAYEDLLMECTRDLHIDHIIGTKITFKDQVYRADAGLSMVEGRNKVQIIGEYFGLGEQDWSQATAYGDSITDVELLKRVGNPVMVEPDELLAQTGKELSWKTLV